MRIFLRNRSFLGIAVSGICLLLWNVLVVVTSAGAVNTDGVSVSVIENPEEYEAGEELTFNVKDRAKVMLKVAKNQMKTAKKQEKSQGTLQTTTDVMKDVNKVVKEGVEAVDSLMAGGTIRKAGHMVLNDPPSSMKDVTQLSFSLTSELMTTWSTSGKEVLDVPTAAGYYALGYGETFQKFDSEIPNNMAESTMLLASATKSTENRLRAVYGEYSTVSDNFSVRADYSRTGEQSSTSFQTYWDSFHTETHNFGIFTRSWWLNNTPLSPTASEVDQLHDRFHGEIKTSFKQWYEQNYK